MKLLGLDVGEKRIGIAVTDSRGIIARPHSVLRRTDLPADLEALCRIVRQELPDRIVVGLPLNMDGSEGPMARTVRGFADRLQASVKRALPDRPVGIHLQDERLSTLEAEDLLRRQGLGWKERKDLVDQTSAALILEEHLLEENLRAREERADPRDEG